MSGSNLTWGGGWKKPPSAAPGGKSPVHLGLKYTTLQKVKISYSSVHQKLQDLPYQQLEGLSNKVMGLKRQVGKKLKRRIQ